MELQGERTIPATRLRTWEALNDPALLKGCIAGCESLERSGDDTMLAVVAVKVGPVNARFKGKLTLADVQAPERYTMHFEGNGGMAGFGKGSTEVVLVEAGARETTLRYAARAQVGGKLAQVGSRLVDAAARKITDDFFAAFEGRLREEAPPAQAPAAAAEAAPAAGFQPPSALWWAASALVLLAAAYAVSR